jgi:hypothetical protein
VVESSRQLGSVWLLEGLWQRLGIADALRGVLGGRRFTTAVERVLFALVCNRAVDPMSKLSAAEWAWYDAAIPGLAGMDEDQAYRAMDLLVAANTQAGDELVVVVGVSGCKGRTVALPAARPRSAPRGGCARPGWTVRAAVHR